MSASSPLRKFEADIRAACGIHRKRLYRLTYGVVNGPEGFLAERHNSCGLCALGAYALEHEVRNHGTDDLVSAFAEHFGVHKSVILSFMKGFDSSPCGEGYNDIDDDAFKMGRGIARDIQWQAYQYDT